jgi:hypothetical protein
MKISKRQNYSEENREKTLTTKTKTGKWDYIKLKMKR